MRLPMQGTRVQAMVREDPTCHRAKIYLRASLVAQWLRIHLPVQETWVRSLVREDPTCRGATKPVCHNY
ncbi:hypothetical protein J1605_022194 [Eschrichtius robustus]|uniref:Uncharacterized protein n=1 Tax=Eschrichtius robustus TaxID=9764 RepID=A0AB34HF88_ESCRO|nr:hypothetical protein J1605_022194 [Eschrichtius robustus]